MEAVPRLLMLKIGLKEYQDYAAMDWMDGGTTDETLQDTIKEQINKHIQNVYSDDPNKYKDCVGNFLELQSAAYRVLQAPDMEGCNTLKKYFGQLHYMQSRFPFVGEDALQVAFIWTDAFTGKFTQQSSFTFEQSAILFNLGAIHSYLGSLDTRATENGTKISCVHFQCAAGFFQYISDHLDTTLSPDISQFMLKLYINTMLGQGQECLFEKSMLDNRKNSVIAKICQQVVDYYKLSLNSLSQNEAKQAMGGDANKHWYRLITFKVAFYSAVTKYYLGNDDWDQEKYGSGVAYFGSAIQSYNECIKLAKNLKGEFKTRAEETLAYSADVFTGRHTSAKKDNDFIYHEKVPDPATLPGASSASLVKPLPFDPSNAAVTGPDIFAKLVPLEAHLTASSYSEEKAKLLRPILAEVEENDNVLEQYKRAIEFDIDKLIKVDDDDRLDPVLVEHCAALSVDQTPIQELTKAIKELSNIYMDIDSQISETISLIEQEENDAKQVKEVCGKTVNSNDEVEKLKEELKVCKDVHEKAAQMNDDLHTAMKVHIDNLRTVSEGLDALKKACNFANTSELITEEDTEVISLMQKLCSKVTEMEVQRRTLVGQLRSQLEEDDVTSALMTNPGIDAEDLFKEELKKHDSLIGYIKQNLAAQENILNAVTEANVRYAKIKKVVDSHKKLVQSKCNNFLLSCTDYTAAVKRCEEGSQFFRELLEQVKETNQKALALNEKNSKLRKIIIDKHEVKKPPPRPTAPKPKSAVGAKPGASLFSSEELAELAAEDMEEFNDPSFLNFLRMSGGLPPGGPTTAGIGSKPFPPAIQNPPSYLRGGTQLPQTTRFSAPASMRPMSNISQANRPPLQQIPPTSSPIYSRQASGGHTSMAKHLPSQLPPAQFTTLGQHSIMTANQQPGLQQQPRPPQQQPGPPHQQPGSPHQQIPGSNTQGMPQNPPIGQHQQPSSAHPPQSYPQFQQPPLSGGQQPMQAHPQVAGSGHPQQIGGLPPGQVAQPLPKHQQPDQINTSQFQRSQTYSQSASFPQSYPQHGGQQPIQQTSQSRSFVRPTQQMNQQRPTSPQPQNFQHPMQPINQQSQFPPTIQTPQSYQQPIASNPQQAGQSPSFQSPQSPQVFPHPSLPNARAPVSQPPHGNPQPSPPGALAPLSQTPQGFPHPNLPNAQLPAPQYSQGFTCPSQPHFQAPVSQPSQGYSRPNTQLPSSQTPQTFQRPTPQPPQDYPRPNLSNAQAPISQPQKRYSRPNVPNAQPPSSQTPQSFQRPNQPNGESPAFQPPQNFPRSNQSNAQPPASAVHSQAVIPPVSQSYQQPAQPRDQQSHNFTQLGQTYQSPIMQTNRSVGHAATVAQNYTQANQPPLRPPISQAPGNVQSSQQSQQGQSSGPPSSKNQPQGAYPNPQQSAQQRFPQSNQPHGYQQQTRPPMPQNQQAPQNFQQPPPPQSFQQPGQQIRPQAHYQMPAPQSQQRAQGSQSPVSSPHHAVQVPQTTPNPSAQAKPEGGPSVGPPNLLNNYSTTNFHQVQQSPIIGRHANIPISNSGPQVGPANTAQPSYPTPYESQQIGQVPHSQSALNKVPPNSNTQNLSEPLAPTVIGSAKLDTPLEPSKPSADLEGLTYIPTNQILLPNVVNTSSADELLTASPETVTNIVREQKTLLVPTKVDGEEMIVTRIDGLPYNNEADLMKFKSETENFQKQISSLLVKTPGSLCQLDKDWKQLSELQEKSARQQSTAVGRCSSYKNRFQDILPFDQNRIVLNEGKDDYINASMVDDISKYCPRFIATQSPLPSSCGDFWTMIHEQYVTLVVMLVGNNEIPKKCAKYWPTDRNVAQKYGSLSITFTTSRSHENYIERTFTLKHAKNSLPRSLTQLQYTAWPEHGQPSSLHDLLSFMDVVSSFHTQQRSLQWPVAVHCENGVGHTGTFCSAYACIKHVDAGLGIPNVLEVVEKMRTKRKYMLQEKAQLKLVHDLVSIRAVELLKQRGVVVDNQPATSQLINKITSPPPSATDKSTFDVFGSSAISSIQASVDKMMVKSHSTNQQPTPVSSVLNTPASTAPAPADINAMIGNNVSDLVQGTISAQPVPEPAVPLAKPDVISNCKDLEQKPNADLTAQLLTNDFELKNPPENPPSTNLSRTSLLDQLTPEAFTLGTEIKEKKRITKADFFKSDSGIVANKNSGDPFADLDPLWGLKK